MKLIFRHIKYILPVVVVIMSILTFTGIASADTLAITGISPSTGVDIGGTNITITGTGFVTGDTVTVGGVSATNIVVVSSTTITATTPTGTDGSQNVVVSKNGVIGTGGSVHSVSVSGNYAYVANYDSNTLQIFDISSSTNPTLVGTAGTGNSPVSASTSGNYAYVVNWGSNTLQIFDISSSTNPTLVGSVNAGGLNSSLNRNIPVVM